MLEAPQKKYAISDIHGCLNTFIELLNSIGLNKTDELYLLGDYVDRGPFSKEVIDYLIQLKNDNYTIHTLWGNHEQMMFDEVLNVDWPPGPPETLKSFGISHLKELPLPYINWLKNLDFFAETEKYILVHAGLNFDLENPLEDDYDLLWVRNWYEDINKEWLGDRIIVHGHTPTQRSLIEKSIDQIQHNPAINIDNGCVFNVPEMGHLCCLDLNSRELVFQKNIDGFYKHQ